MPLTIITAGNTTTQGGRVISGSPTHTFRGRPIARLGDQVDGEGRYPNGMRHGINKIVECSATFTVGGTPVALEGHKTACGCALVGCQLGTVG